MSRIAKVLIRKLVDSGKAWWANNATDAEIVRVKAGRNQLAAGSLSWRLDMWDANGDKLPSAAGYDPARLCAESPATVYHDDVSGYVVIEVDRKEGAK